MVVVAVLVVVIVALVLVAALAVAIVLTISTFTCIRQEILVVRRCYSTKPPESLNISPKANHQLTCRRAAAKPRTRATVGARRRKD